MGNQDKDKQGVQAENNSTSTPPVQEPKPAENTVPAPAQEPEASDADKQPEKIEPGDYRLVDGPPNWITVNGQSIYMEKGEIFYVKNPDVYFTELIKQGIVERVKEEKK